MPYKDVEKAKEAKRTSARRRREGSTKVEPRGLHAAQNVDPDVDPDVDPIGRPLKTIHWTDADGKACVTTYTPPRADWKGVGWCRECNARVADKDNCCRVCFFTPEKAKVPPVDLSKVRMPLFVQTTTVPAWYLRPDHKLTNEDRARVLAALMGDKDSKRYAPEVRWGLNGPTVAELGR